MPTTKREIAESLGVTKPTVSAYIRKLGLESHVRRTGQADVIDDEAASAIADAISKNVAARVTPGESATDKSPVIAAMSARIDDLREQVARLSAEGERERERHEREVDALRDQLADANARADEFARQLSAALSRAQEMAERQQLIAAAPWWRRGALTRRLLGPAGDAR